MAAHNQSSAANQQGFTLVELVVVLAVVAILASQAGPAFSTLIANTRTKNATSTLHLTLVKARSESVKRSVPVTIQAKGGYWHFGWTMTAGGDVIAEEGGVHDAADPVNVFGGIEVDANLTTLNYRPSGRVQTASSPQFEIADYGGRAQVRCVLVNLSGRPLVLKSVCPTP